MGEHNIEFSFMVPGVKLTKMQENCYKLSDCLINCSLDGFSYELVISQELKNINQFTPNSVTESKPHNAADDHCVESVRILSFSVPNAGKYGPGKLQIRTLFMQWIQLR